MFVGAGLARNLSGKQTDAQQNPPFPLSFVNGFLFLKLTNAYPRAASSQTQKLVGGD